MGMITTRQLRLRGIALLLAGVSLIALAGCGKGDTKAPFGSKIEVVPFGAAMISGGTNTTDTGTTKTQSYRVTVVDPDGLPMDGVDVDLVGQFTSGASINFGGIVTGSAPISLSSTDHTVNGVLFFDVTAPYFNLNAPPLGFPFNQTAAGSSTGGTLMPGTYFYTVTTVDFKGESNAATPYSAIVTGATPTSTEGSVVLTWAAVPGAVAYRVYGRTFGAVSLMVEVSPGSATTFTDNGSYTPTGITPPATDGTGFSLNSIKGTLQASTGFATAEPATIDF